MNCIIDLTKETCNKRKHEVIMLNNDDNNDDVQECKKMKKTNKQQNYRDSVQQAILDLEENGFAIVPKTLDEDQCEEVSNDMFSWLESLNSNFKRDDPTSWTTENMPHAMHGIIKQYGVGHTAWCWNVRNRNRVQAFFRNLYNSEVNNWINDSSSTHTMQNSLVTSFDGACIVAPNKQHSGRAWFHLDQSPKNGTSRQCVQGFVTINDMNAEDNTLHVLKQSHKHFKEFAKEFHPETGSWPSKDWIKLTSTQKEWFNSRGCKEVRIDAPAGSLVLWDSRVVHCTAPAKQKNNPKWRMVVYVCMMPRSRCTEKVILKRKRAYKDQRTTNHWPIRPSLNGLKFQTYGESLNKWALDPRADKLLSLEISQKQLKKRMRLI